MLCPAACAAAALNDPQCLEQIQKIAEADLACIDAHHPEYEHSTKSAFTRKMPGIFHTLAMEAKAKIFLMKSRAFTDKL